MDGIYSENRGFSTVPPSLLWLRSSDHDKQWFSASSSFLVRRGKAFVNGEPKPLQPHFHLSSHYRNRFVELGGTPLMELMIVVGKAFPKLQLELGLAVDRIYTGLFMTSLDMAGFSISIMKADPSILQRLDAPTKARYWPVAVDVY